MLQIPQWSTASDRGDGSEVVDRWRRTYGPFKSPCVPRIVTRLRSVKVGKNKVRNKYQRGDALYENANRFDQIPYFPATPGFVRVDTARHAKQAGNVHRVKRQVKTDREEPEMEFAQGFVQ